MAQEKRIQVIAPDGKLGTVPEGQLQDALNQGYKVQEADAGGGKTAPAAPAPPTEGLLARANKLVAPRAPEKPFSILPRTENIREFAKGAGRTLLAPANLAEEATRGASTQEELAAKERAEDIPLVGRLPGQGQMGVLGERFVGAPSRRGAEKMVSGDPLLAAQGAIEQIPLLGPLLTNLGEQISTNPAGLLGEAVTGLFTPGAKAGANIGGRNVPVTRGMKNPEGLLAGIERGVQEIPFVGKPIRQAKEDAIAGGKRVIEDVASRATGGRITPRGAGQFTSTVRDAAASYKQRASATFENIKRGLGHPSRSTRFDQLQLERQNLQEALFKGNPTGQEATLLRRSLDQVERDFDALFASVNPALRRSFEQANALHSRGAAIDTFAGVLERGTKGLPEGAQAGGLKSVTQKLQTGALLENVKLLNKRPKQQSVSQLERAFGKQGAQDITQAVELLDRANRDRGLAARVRTMATNPLAQGLFIGGGTYGAVLSPQAAIAALGVGRIFANVLARKPSLIREFLRATPNSRKAALVTAQMIRIAQEDGEKEQ